jgi:hypothetical protein
VQAYQSTPDMNALYMRFAQQENADEQFNRGIANIAAAFSPLSQRASIAASGAGQTTDPGALFNNIMKIQGWQQQQKQYQAFIDSAPDLAQRTGLTPNEVIAHGPDTINTALALGIPPEALRTRNAFRQQYITDHANDPGPDGKPIGSAGAAAAFDQQVPMSLTALGASGAGGAAGPLMQRNLRQGDWQSRHPGEPIPPYFNSDEALAAHDAQVASLSASQTEAGKTLPGLEGNLADMRSKASEILKAPNLQDVLDRAPNTIAMARQQGGWGPLIAQGVAGMSTEDLKLLQQIDELSRYPTSEMKSANPHLMTSIAPIDNALTPLSNFRLGADNFKTSTQSLIDSIDNAHAQAIGASGQLDKALDDPNILKRVDPSYLGGGKQYLGDPKSVPADELAMAKAAIAQGKPRDLIVRNLQARGFVPKPGEL